MEKSKEVAVLEKKVMPLVQRANDQMIESAEDMKEATETLSLLGTYYDSVVEAREKITSPLNAALTAARNMFNPIEKPAKAAIDDLRKRIGAYQTKEAARVKEEEGKLAGRIGEGKGKLKIETAERKAGEIERPDEAIHTEAGALKFRTDYEFHLEDPIALIKATGDDFIELTLRKNPLKEAAKEGRKIPGIRIEEVQVPVNIR